MNDCIFCKIIRGEIPASKIWEDADHIAILDAFPNTQGMALVLTKKHFGSYAFDMPEHDYSELMKASRLVGKLLDKKLNVGRTAMVLEGMGVDHIHVKLYPLHGLKKHFSTIENSERKFFEKYEGYITTLMGPKADKKELDTIAKKIRDD